MNFKLVFKTKGGHKEGMGDVTSSLALATEFINQGHDVSFVINNNNNVIKLISLNDFKYEIFENVNQIEKYLLMQCPDIAVLNQLNSSIDEALIFKNCTKLLVTIDDTGVAAEHADQRFNVLYPIANSISDLKYIPLPASFQQKHYVSKTISKHIKTILVTQGGSDTYGFTPKILGALDCIDDQIDIKAVLGPNFSHFQELDKVLQNLSRKITIIRGENDLSDLMLGADLAISAGGNTMFELACLGVPAVVICGEPFEVETAERLEKEGFSISLGFGERVAGKEIADTLNRLIDDVLLRTKMSLKGKQLIDGQGVKRIAAKIIDAYRHDDHYAKRQCID